LNLLVKEQVRPCDLQISSLTLYAELSSVGSVKLSPSWIRLRKDAPKLSEVHLLWLPSQGFPRTQ